MTVAPQHYVTIYQGYLAQALRLIYCRNYSAFAIEDACWLITLNYILYVERRVLG